MRPSSERISFMTRKEHLDRIKAADKAYYEDDNPIMLDSEYDNLRNEYIKLYGSDDLNYVPGNVSAGLKPFKHDVPVTSLAKIKEAETDKAVNRISELWPVVIEPKFDGLTVVAYPNPDGSCIFVTRGLAGEVGEVLPNFISKYTGAGVNTMTYPVRGEVYLTNENFDTINSLKEEKGEELFSNPRNAAAGILRKLEKSPYIDYLSYIVYDVIGCDASETEKIKMLKENTTFDVVEPIDFSSVGCTDSKSLAGHLPSFLKEYKDNHDIPIDGLVVKSDITGSLDKFGKTSHHPNNAFAFKGEQERVETVLKDVIWQMGRSRLTPVAIFEPVELDGSIISKASIHNINIIKSLGLKIGDTVEIEKANEIIPQIVKVTEHDIDGKNIEIPDKCSYCGEKFNEVNGQLFCVNDECEGRLIQDIAYMADKSVLDIRGLSVKTVEKIVDTFEISAPCDILLLSKEEIGELPGFKDKSVDNLYGQIQKAAKSQPIEKIIPACCIMGIGHDVGKILASNFETVKDILQACESGYDFTKLEGIGKVTSDILVSEKFYKRLTYLTEECIEEVKENKLYMNNVRNDEKTKLTFVLTGKMSKPRAKIEVMIYDHGHDVSDKLSARSHVDYLVSACPDSNSAKFKTAKKNGIKIISEQELYTILEA